MKRPTVEEIIIQIQKSEVLISELDLKISSMKGNIGELCGIQEKLAMVPLNTAEDREYAKRVNFKVDYEIHEFSKLVGKFETKRDNLLKIVSEQKRFILANMPPGSESKQ